MASFNTVYKASHVAPHAHDMNAENVLIWFYLHLECCWLHQVACQNQYEKMEMPSLREVSEELITRSVLPIIGHRNLSEHVLLAEAISSLSNQCTWAVYRRIANHCVEQWMNWLACRENRGQCENKCAHTCTICFTNAHSQPLAHIFNDNINMSAWTSF